MTSKNPHVDPKHAPALQTCMRSLVATIPPAIRKAWAEEIAEAAPAKAQSKQTGKKDS